MSDIPSSPAAGDAEEIERAGLSALLDPDQLPAGRHPLLAAVLRESARLLEISLRAITSDTLEVTLASLGTTRYGRFLEGLPEPALLGVLEAEPWGGPLLIAVGPDLVFGLLEATLGGSAGQSGAAPVAAERAFTSIETRVGRAFLEMLATDATAEARAN